MIERISSATPKNLRWGHEARYRWAAGYLEPGDVVLDAACGVGYGSKILNAHGDVIYYGVDLDKCVEPAYHPYGMFLQANLEDGFPLTAWQSSVDVTVSFETIEHLKDPEAFVAKACEWTTRYMILSVPVVPTKKDNPFHLHDFGFEDVPAMVHKHPAWREIVRLEQPTEFSAIYAFQRDAV